MNTGVKVAVQIATGDEEIPPGADWSVWVGTALAAAKVGASKAGCVTLRLVGREESQHLNEMYRHKLGPTNVLAFPSGHDSGIPDIDVELGDLVICLPVMHAEAEEQGKAPLAHLAHLIVHGTLHLAGFDHVASADAIRMEALETRIMLGLGFTGPYEADNARRVDETVDEGDSQP